MSQSTFVEKKKQRWRHNPSEKTGRGMIDSVTGGLRETMVIGCFGPARSDPLVWFTRLKIGTEPGIDTNL